jgi:hypothetical protein
MRKIIDPILNLWKLLPLGIRGGSLIIKFKDSGLGSYLVNIIHGNAGIAKAEIIESTAIEESVDLIPVTSFYRIYDCAQLETTLETVLLVIHDADRSATSILGLGLINELKANFNVIVLLLNENDPLLALFKSSGAVAVVGAKVGGKTDLDISTTKMILEKFPINFAIISSIESALHVGASFIDTSIVPINLIHEFVSDDGDSQKALREICSNSGIFIFSGQTTLANAQKLYPSMKDRDTYFHPKEITEIDLQLNANDSLSSTPNISYKLDQLACEKFHIKDYAQKIIQTFRVYKSSYMRDLKVLEANKGELDNSFFRSDDLNARCQKISLEEFYLKAWKSSSLHRRKPFPGFHPGIYQEFNKLPKDYDPFADFLVKNKPDGPWLKKTITLNKYADLSLPTNSQVALHIHAHYFDLFEEIIDALNKNTIRPDLFISITNDDLCFKIHHAIKGYSGRVMALQVYPNRGRDLAPLLLGDMSHKIMTKYEYLGHVHTKRSSHSPSWYSTNWRQFLIANLLGIGNINSADQILNHLATHPEVGLVFPDDPNIVSWDGNLTHAMKLANSMHIEVLPDHFNFPIGTMFWAKTKALAPLIELNLSYEDFPEEPLLIDGTMLHALERLLPFIAEKAGFSYALVNSGLLTRFLLL